MTRFEFRKDLIEDRMLEGTLIEENDNDGRPPNSETRRIYRLHGKFKGGDRFNFKGYSLQELHKNLPDDLKHTKKKV